MIGTPANSRVTRPVALSLAIISLAIFAPGMRAAASDSAPRPPYSSPVTVGMEARLQTNLPGARLAPKPLDPGSPFVLRIADTRLHGSLIAYDFRYFGLEPGHYDLRDYLTRNDGSGMSNLPPLVVEVTSLLPLRHNGLLIEPTASRSPRLGGYLGTMIAAAMLWIFGLAFLMLRAGRKPVPIIPVEVPAEPVSLTERIRPLAEEAAAGTLGTEGKAQLERLILAHWRAQLNLQDVAITDALQQLREHPEAGELMRALEDWLHRPPGSAAVDLERLLAPYRPKPTPTSSGELQDAAAWASRHPGD